MLETSARLLRLLSLLQTPRDWTGPDLAERLEVSTRTVRNDVDRLRRLGYPVEATRGAIGGYRLGPGAQLPPLLLDDEEAVAVAVGLRAGAEGAVAGIEETSLRALRKLEQVLPHRLRRRVQALGRFTVPVPRDDGAAPVDVETLTLLTGAARDHERVRLDYTTHSGSALRRTVEPYRLVSWGRRWYLVAWDVEKSDWRTFRVDRLVPRPPFGPRFTPRELPDDDVAAYVSRRASAAAWRYRARVVVHAPAAEVAARISPAVGTVEAMGEHAVGEGAGGESARCVLVTGADTVQTLAVYLGMLDADFEVTEPPELVAYVAELAARYARAAPRDP